MFDHKIEILAYKEMRDEYNDRTDELVHIATCCACRTEAGGRENLYAGRIVHENEIVYTVRWRAGIEAGMVIKEYDRIHRIISVHEEGRRWRLHIKVTKSDADNQG